MILKQFDCVNYFIVYHPYSAVLRRVVFVKFCRQLRHIDLAVFGQVPNFLRKRYHLSHVEMLELLDVVT